MATQSQRRTSAQQSAEQGLIARTLSKLLYGLVFLLLTLLFSILIEWLGIATQYWDEPGTQHSETMLQQELGYLNQDFHRSVLVAKPVRFAKSFADHFYALLFKDTGIEKGVIALATPTPGLNDGAVRRRLRQGYQMTRDYILAAMVVTQIFAVRLAVLTLALPAFVLLALMGLTDGLVQRDIRRWCGGRESSFVYHWAKKILYPSLVLPWIIYLAMPESVHPNWIVLPFAVLFAISIRLMASTFKKYL